MAMLRSALGRVSRRLLGPSEIIRTPPLPSLRPAETLMSHPQPATRLMRTFTSPTGAAAGTRRVPNFQGWRHFPVISKVNEGMKCSQQMRFLSVESKEPSATGVLSWLDRHFGPRRQLMLVMVVGVSSFVATTIAYRRLDKAPTATNKFKYTKKRG